MKILGFALVVAAIAALVHFKPWEEKSGSSTTDSAEPTAEFMEACVEGAPDDINLKEKFCNCLWEKGVRNGKYYKASLEGRDAMHKCVLEKGM